MFDYANLTYATKEALQAAKRVARELRSDYVGTTHLLLGLMDSDRRFAISSRAIEMMGLDRDVVRSEILKVAVTGPEMVTIIGEVPCSTIACECVELAAEAAAESGSVRVTRGHLMLGLLRAKSSIASKILRKLGVEEFKIRNAFRIHGEAEHEPRQEEGRLTSQADVSYRNLVKDLMTKTNLSGVQARSVIATVLGWYEESLEMLASSMLKEDDPPESAVGREPVHEFFGLSYAQYLTIPRSVLQSMPLRWQKLFIDLLEELDETIDWRPTEGQYRVQLYEIDPESEELYWVRPLTDPFEDYERGRRRVPYRGGEDL